MVQAQRKEKAMTSHRTPNADVAAAKSEIINPRLFAVPFYGALRQCPLEFLDFLLTDLSFIQKQIFQVGQTLERRQIADGSIFQKQHVEVRQTFERAKITDWSLIQPQLSQVRQTDQRGQVCDTRVR